MKKHLTCLPLGASVVAAILAFAPAAARSSHRHTAHQDSSRQDSSGQQFAAHLLVRERVAGAGQHQAQHPECCGISDPHVFRPLIAATQRSEASHAARGGIESVPLSRI